MGQDLSLLSDISIALDPLLATERDERRGSTLTRPLPLPSLTHLHRILRDRARGERLRELVGRLRLQGPRSGNTHDGSDEAFHSTPNVSPPSRHRLTLDLDTPRSRSRRSRSHMSRSMHSLYTWTKIVPTAPNGLATSKPKFIEKIINGVTKVRSGKSRKNSTVDSTEACCSVSVNPVLNGDNGCTSFDTFDADNELNTWKDNQITKSLLAEITENLSKCGSCSPKFLHHSRWRYDTNTTTETSSHPTTPDGTRTPVIIRKTIHSSISLPASPYNGSPYNKQCLGKAPCSYQYHSIYNTNDTFKQSVMEKGYVKAMVDVINHTKGNTDVPNTNTKSAVDDLDTSEYLNKSFRNVRDIYVTKFENASASGFVSCSSDLSVRSCDSRSDQASTSTDDSGVHLPDHVFCGDNLSKRSSGICFFTSNDGMLQSPADLFDKSWCDSKNIFESDLSDESDCEEKEIQPQICKPLAQAPKDELEGSRPGDKLFNIAYELLKTERAYVERLHLVDQVFHARIADENATHSFLPPNVIPRMFSNIASIFQFHREFLLPGLESRMKQWDSLPKIGDLMKKNAPFLKLYSEYVRNFDTAMTCINQWANKSPKFADIMNTIHKLPECGSLSLQHHMLEPIQRVPRYELLLKDYLRHLPPDSSDSQDTQEALKLVTTAASHSNEAMRKLEGFRKLLEIHQSLGGSIDLISPTRELIKEGKIMKISARRERTQERYILLFNDIILICSEHLLGTYRVRAKLDVSGMQVTGGDNRHIPHTFKVRSKQKSIEFQAISGEECDDWIMIIQQTIDDFNKKKELRGKLIQDIELGCMAPEWVKDEAVTMCMTCAAPSNAFRQQHHHCRESIIQDIELGCMAPEWVKDEAVTMCMTCAAPFNAFRRRHPCRESIIQDIELGCMAPEWVKDEAVTMCMTCAAPFNAFRRRHHCRACGIVICSKCSSQRLALSYDENRINRVCDKCYRTLSGSVSEDEGTEVGRGNLLRIKANNPGVVISGYLLVSVDKGKSWARRWTVIHESFVLYLYKAHQDVCALQSLPLPGYQISQSLEDPLTFHLSHPNTHVKASELYVTVDKEHLYQRWIEVLEKVINAELPAPDSDNHGNNDHGINNNHESNNSHLDDNRNDRGTKTDRLSSGSESSGASVDVKPS